MPAALPIPDDDDFGSVLMTAVMTGADPHKGSHTAVVIGPAEEPLGELRVCASAAQAQKLIALRSLKRRISDAIYARLQADARQAAKDTSSKEGSICTGTIASYGRLEARRITFLSRWPQIPRCTDLAGKRGYRLARAGRRSLARSADGA
jgi:hypothetical protein